MKGATDLTHHDRVVKEKHDDYFRFTLGSCVVEDSGTYCILVRNKFGVDRAFITVKVSVVGREMYLNNLLSILSITNAFCYLFSAFYILFKMRFCTFPAHYYSAINRQ